MKVIFVRGIQGSGKSTWAKQWVAEDPTHRIRISWDDIRNMLGPYWIPEREQLVKNISYDMLRNALSDYNAFGKYDVVIDNMNLSEHSIRCFVDICNTYRADIQFQDFRTPLEECIRRDALRTNPIGEKVIRDTYNRHKDFYFHETL